MNFGANPFGMKTLAQLEAERIAEERARQVAPLDINSMPALDPNNVITTTPMITSPTGRFTTGPDGRRVPDMRTRTGHSGAPLPTSVVNRLNQLENPSNNQMPGANGISAADLAALAKQAQATPDYAAMATEQMSTMPTHTMPDGTVHPGATHADYLAMQQQQAQDAMTRGMNAYNQIDPGMKEAADTDRKRDRTSFGEMLLSRMNQADPGMLTPAEKMIRTGGAIVGAADQGALAAMEAAGKAYGGIQDYERAQEQRQIQNELDRQTKSGLLTGQQQADLNIELGGYEDQIRMMDTALTGLEGATDITGPIAGTWKNFWDPRTDDDKARARATIRLQLKRLRVSNILENTKNTKGAISDKEMALFAEDSPTMDMQEGVWIDFITRRREVLRRIVYRLKNNIRVDPKTGIEYSADGQEIAPTTNTMQNNNVSADIEADFNNIILD